MGSSQNTSSQTDCAIAPLTQVVQHASGGSGHLAQFLFLCSRPILCPFILGPSQTNKVESDLECLLCLMPLHRASLTCLLQRQLAPSGTLCHLSASVPSHPVSCQEFSANREQLCETLCGEQDTRSVHASLLGHCCCVTAQSCCLPYKSVLPRLHQKGGKVPMVGQQSVVDFPSHF